MKGREMRREKGEKHTYEIWFIDRSFSPYKSELT